MKTVTASCEQGDLLGIDANGVQTFFDIPYAKDGGRYREALPPQSWHGVREATQPGPVFPQLASRLDFVMGATAGGVPTSEDAYRLNVYTPSTQAKLPVIFWIHGGGFLTGGALRCYSGAQLAGSGRAVVVTFNYRLGILGNLYLPGTSPGNLSVADIVAALIWVRANIARFGGDPDAIVLAGQSAGAWYTQLLMSMEETSALARAAIMLSWPGLPPQSPDDALETTRDYCEIAGFQNPPRELWDASVSSLLEWQTRLLRARAQNGAVPVGFMPVASGPVPANPMQQAARFAPKPLMISWTRDETGSFFGSNPSLVDATKNDVIEWLEPALGANCVTDYERAMHRRLGSTPYTVLVEQTSEALFKRPTLEAAARLSDSGSDVYAFAFDVASPQPHVGAGHCFELPFLFGNFTDWPSAPMLEGIDGRLAAQLSALLQAYVLNFAESGNPNAGDLPSWRSYRDGNQYALRFADSVTCDPATLNFSA
ncbi:Phenmedipham hydrolase [Pandoraea communis]|uniref:Carboxylic ester hydrolase n=1 Tax=Pandoraea communis TaxID=2508297 RepID=A0A5E4UT61_9BURK|nr:carboxylesterase family protein [Pandoraea communis]VVE02694.1 Phenmedipham hydrolase [Pandoraea communis]